MMRCGIVTTAKTAENNGAFFFFSTQNAIYHISHDLPMEQRVEAGRTAGPASLFKAFRSASGAASLTTLSRKEHR
jgi:hypothetical protein